MNDTRLFDDTPDLERRVRERDPESSWAAAQITPGQATVLKDTILAIIGDIGPATDDAIFADYRRRGGRRTGQRVRTARAELSHPKTGAPLIVEDNVTGLSDAGNRARRWVVAL